jgi:hypothetical protein
MIRLKMSERLGRLIRADDFSTLGKATCRELVSSIRGNEWGKATQLSAYFLNEINTVRKIYTEWCAEIVRWCRKYPGEGDSALLISRTTSPWYEMRYRAAVGFEATELFTRLLSDDSTAAFLSPMASNLSASIERHDHNTAVRQTEELRARSQLFHDIYTDWCWSIMTYVSRAYGEEEVTRLIRETVAPWFKERYDRYFALPEDERLQLTVEGMRGHLCGPGRLGDVEVADEGNRWVISFDPCGSGGRMRRGDSARGDPPRTEAPYSFGVSSRGHDWTWGQAGVCYYCAHCAIVNEQLAIDTYGHPIRVTEYPRDPGHPCRWIIYKNVSDIPEEYYERVGRAKPGRDT